MDRLVTRRRMPETHANVRLVRSFIFRKTDVAIDAQQRSAMRLGINNQPCAHLAYTQAQIADEAHARIACEFVVFRFVLKKPRSPVVATELSQELKQTALEIRRCHEMTVEDCSLCAVIVP